MRIIPIASAFATLLAAAPAFAATIPVSATGTLTVGDLTLPFDSGQIDLGEHDIQTLLVEDFQARARVSYFHQQQTHHIVLTGAGPLISGGDAVGATSRVEFTLPEGALYNLTVNLFKPAPEDMMTAEYAIDGHWQAVPRDSSWLTSGAFSPGDHTLEWRVSTWDATVTPSVHFSLVMNTVPEPASWLLLGLGASLIAGYRLHRL